MHLLMCYGQGGIKLGLNSESSNKVLCYNILRITQFFKEILCVYSRYYSLCRTGCVTQPSLA